MRGVRKALKRRAGGIEQGELYVVLVPTLGGERLGHGAFRFEHLDVRFKPDGYVGGATDNLMDDGAGRHLGKWQWDNAHDPEFNVAIFDKEGESVLAAISCAQDYKLSDEALGAVAANVALHSAVAAFISGNDCTSEAAAYADYALRAIAVEERYIWERFEELYALLAEDGEYGLLSGCEKGGSDYSEWSDLASFELSGKAKARITNSNKTWDVQDIEDGEGAILNLDYFPVEVRVMPYNTNGVQMLAEELFQYFRLNINDFAAKFTPYDDPYDVELWNSNDAVGTVMQIKMVDLAFEYGDVICSQHDECCWVFSTLNGAPGIFGTGSSYHPVAGNRKFGYKINGSNTIIYTKGADRAYGRHHALLNIFPEFTLNQGAIFWRNMQSNLIDFVESNGGEISKSSPSEIVYRPKWSAVREALMSDTPVISVPCE